MNTLTTPAEWNDFLKIFTGGDAGDQWSGCDGASEDKLLATEKRLKIKLPPSYRAFLTASNGWKNASRAIPVLRPVEKTRWFKREHREWVEAYTAPMQGMDLPLPPEQDYFNYSSEHCGSFDDKHLAQTLCISEVGDSAVLLLNPMVIWPDGEWEAWFFANWVPGAVRYRSFAEWMRHEAAERRNEPCNPVQTPGELPTVYRDGPAKETRRIRPREEVLTLDEVRKRLMSKTRSRRIKAVQSLFRIDDSDAVVILLDLLKNDCDFNVRCEAAETLGKLRSPEAIEPLIVETSEYTRVSSSAISAMAFFNDEQTAQCLIKLVEDNGLSATVAAHVLALRKDTRGVKPLLNLLLSNDPRDQHTGDIAGRFIAEFEEAGLAALAPLVTHVEESIRQRALGGITDIATSSTNKELRAKACHILEQCLERESGGRMHQWLATCVAVACNKKVKIDDNPFAVD